MTSFAPPTLLENRYAAIAETSIYTYDDDDLVNYADFLKKHGRYMTKGGYVDGSRRVRSLFRQQDDVQGPKHQASPSRSGLLAAIDKSASSAPATTTAMGTVSSRKLKGSSDKTEHPTSMSNIETLESKKRDYDKQMKLIEEEMIRAKQSEREAKRLEGDIKKEQRYLQHSLRDLDVDATKKRYYAEKNLSKNLEEKDKIEREFVKTKEKQTKQRTNHLIDSLQTNKDKDRRNLLLCNDLARQYRTKVNELDIRHNQLNRLQNDFEQKLQRKELEESRIKKELAEIALALNLEAQKAKNDMKDFLKIIDHDQNQNTKYDIDQELKFESRLNQGNGHGKNSELERRRHSGDLTVRHSVLDIKQRDAFRRIGDTRSRLETVYAKQRALNASVAVTEHDRRATNLMSKMTDIENRRSKLMHQYIHDKNEKVNDRSKDVSNVAKTRHTEIESKRHEDHLRYLEKVVNESEELEYELRKSVKEAEFQRRKKEQEVQRLRDDLIRKKREDAKKIREAIARSEQEERQIERHLAKEKAKLHKFQARRENDFARLTHQKSQIDETKSLLKVHEREHERLLRVQIESQSLQSLNTI